jgi:hypothetical protein
MKEIINANRVGRSFRRGARPSGSSEADGDDTFVES